MLAALASAASGREPMLLTRSRAVRRLIVPIKPQVAVWQRKWIKMIDARTEKQLQRLIQQRDQLAKEAEALKNKIAGLDMAIGLIGDLPARQEASMLPGKVHVSETI